MEGLKVPELTVRGESDVVLAVLCKRTKRSVHLACATRCAAP